MAAGAASLAGHSLAAEDDAAVAVHKEASLQASAFERPFWFFPCNRLLGAWYSVVIFLLLLGLVPD